MLAVSLLLAAPARGQTPAPDEFPVFRALARIAADLQQPKEERLTALKGLEKAAHPSVTPTVLGILADRDPGLRAASASALGWEGNREATEPLLARATDGAEPPEVRTAAIAALGRIGDARALPAVEVLARARTPAIRREALLALMESPLARGTDRVAAAIALLGDLEQDGYTRARAAALLEAAKDRRAVGPLVRVLRDPRLPAGFAELPLPQDLSGEAQVFAARLRSLHNVRARAARALGTLGAVEAEPALRDALADSDPLVRIQSATALGLMRARNSGAALLGAMEDPDVRVRQMAAFALGAVSDPAAAPVLLQALAHPEPGLRERAAWALGRLRNEAARDALTRLADEDPIPTVRRAAHWALEQLDGASGGESARPDAGQP